MFFRPSYISLEKNIENLLKIVTLRLEFPVTLSSMVHKKLWWKRKKHSLHRLSQISFHLSPNRTEWIMSQYWIHSPRVSTKMLSQFVAVLAWSCNEQLFFKKYDLRINRNSCWRFEFWFLLYCYEINFFLFASFCCFLQRYKHVLRPCGRYNTNRKSCPLLSKMENWNVASIIYDHATVEPATLQAYFTTKQVPPRTAKAFWSIPVVSEFNIDS
jgi:hypothetical protein